MARALALKKLELSGFAQSISGIQANLRWWWGVPHTSIHARACTRTHACTHGNTRVHEWHCMANLARHEHLTVFYATRWHVAAEATRSGHTCLTASHTCAPACSSIAHEIGVPTRVVRDGRMGEGRDEWSVRHTLRARSRRLHDGRYHRRRFGGTCGRSLGGSVSACVQCMHGGCGC